MRHKLSDWTMIIQRKAKVYRTPRAFHSLERFPWRRRRVLSLPYLLNCFSHFGPHVVGNMFRQNGKHQLFFLTLLIVQFNGGLDAPATVEEGSSQRHLIQTLGKNAETICRQIECDIGYDQRNVYFVVDRTPCVEKQRSCYQVHDTDRKTDQHCDTKRCNR